MKSFFTLVCLSAMAFPVFGQNWTVLNPPSGLIAVDKSLEEKKIYFDIVNTGNDTIALEMERLENVLASDGDTSHLTYFCWDLCYGTNGNMAIEPVFIAPGDTLNYIGSGDGQYLAFLPGGIDGYSRTTMAVRNANDPTEFVLLVYEFSVGGATNSITDAALAARSLSNPTPNPAQNLFSVTYDLPQGQAGTLGLYNLIGKEVRMQSLSGGQGEARMEVADLPRGIYFLHLKSQGRAISSRRVVLR